MAVQQMQRNSKRKSAGDKRGEFKLRVWFIQHKLPKAFTMFSTVRQDNNNNAFVRNLRKKIDSGDWKGTVNHATFYSNGEPFLEYTDWTQGWNAPGTK